MSAGRRQIGSLRDCRASQPSSLKSSLHPRYSTAVEQAWDLSFKRRPSEGSKCLLAAERQIGSHSRLSGIPAIFTEIELASSILNGCRAGFGLKLSKEAS